MVSTLTREKFDKTQSNDFDLKALQSTHCDQSFTPDAIYQAFETSGIHYGKTFQALEHVFLNSTRDEILASLVLPKEASEKADLFILHPSLLDAAIGAGVVFNLISSESNTPYLPFALDSITILKPPT